MSIRALKVFLTVCRQGTFAAAAEKMDISQAAVSLQMKALEAELKVKLFDRVGRVATLSTSGRALLPMAQRIVHSYENLASSLKTEDLAGPFSVGAAVAMMDRLVPDALSRLARLYPKIEIKLTTGLSADIAEQIRRGELDTGVVAGLQGATPKALVARLVVRHPFVLIAPRALKIERARATLLQQPFISLVRGDWAGRAIEEFLRKKKVNVRVVMELESPQLITNMVKQGRGVSVIPAYDGLWRERPPLQVLRVKGLALKRDIHLVERRRHARTALTSAFLNCLIEERWEGPKQPPRLLPL